MKEVFISARQVMNKAIYCLTIKDKDSLESQIGILHTTALRACLFSTYLIKDSTEVRFYFENERISNYVKSKLPKLDISRGNFNSEVFKTNLSNIISKINKDFKYYRGIDKSLFRTMDF